MGGPRCSDDSIASGGGERATARPCGRWTTAICGISASPPPTFTTNWHGHSGVTPYRFRRGPREGGDARGKFHQEESAMAVLTVTAAPLDRRWRVLALVVAAQFMFVVDAFVVNVAIPSIRADLNATTGEIQGVIVLYQIAFATLIVTGGRLGDICGGKPVFLLGLLGFTLASAWCGLAHSGGDLVTARVLQGAAAALMIPQVLATIHRLFRDEERGRAFGVFGFTLGFGAAVGFGLGGWLVALDVAALGWRTIFFVNVPIGLALMGATLWLMPAMAGKPGTKLDIVGAAVLLVALLCLIGPVLLGADLAWAPWLFAVVAGGLIMLATMWPLERWVERRRGLPLVHLDLMQDASFVIGLLAVFFFTF